MFILHDKDVPTMWPLELINGLLASWYKLFYMININLFNWCFVKAAKNQPFGHASWNFTDVGIKLSIVAFVTNTLLRFQPLNFLLQGWNLITMLL
jgi:hypothetical protein